MEFQELMTPVMTQILGWRMHKVRANLDNLTLLPLVKFVDGHVSPNHGMDVACARIDHLAQCVGAQRYEKRDLDELEVTFREKDGLERFVRGKYLIWFLANYLVHLHANISQFVSAYAKPPKVKLPVGAANVMVLAAPRARIPQSLKIFLENTFLYYVKHSSA
jgi:hypothetical protein